MCDVHEQGTTTGGNEKGNILSFLMANAKQDWSCDGLEVEGYKWSLHQ
jgi:hypothetical protein